MSVRSTSWAAIRVTAPASTIGYELCWFDTTASIVPLWWLGAWRADTDELLLTEVLQAPARISPAVLVEWLRPIVGNDIAAVLAAGAADAVTALPRPSR